ncbi:septum site-determining protein MinC [Telmatospirillum siberiense]|uniref:Probable septum site-determining protein MinC n=1 Tax=Telmatospirillum siberiense TaxID=382514 RepID=A0A2N3PRZ9_9PROT|nr:septum site-determining protein MinC [Telmatospirillum siberiense]PKU23156.1 septum site-determining protein MinC [Telmatospirillum siberiense]
MEARRAGTVSNDSPLPFQIRGTSSTLLALKVIDPCDPAFFIHLANTLALAPGFYRNAPIILDLAAVARKNPVDLTIFCAQLRELTLTPVGIQGATADWERNALAAGLAVFPAGRSADPVSVHGRAAPLPRPSTARLVTEPVRSGQQVYAAESDLIVTAPVSRGAELLADGNIHVYGPLRGRALAGTNGDRSARIFCRHFDADLISIAGYYEVNEHMEPHLFGKPVQIRLDNERLIFEPL